MTEDRRAQRLRWLLAEFWALREAIGEALGPSAVPQPPPQTAVARRRLERIIIRLAAMAKDDFELALVASTSQLGFLIDRYGREHALSREERQGLMILMISAAIQAMEVAYGEEPR